jgi:hypothetical protein
MARSRSWTYAGGIVATAAVIGVVAFATGSVPGFDHADDDVVPVGQPSASHPSPSAPVSTATSSSAVSSPSTGPASASPTTAYAVYYVGADPHGRPVLFREFHRAADLPTADPAGTGDDLLTEAVHDALATPPLDPDYLTPWAGRARLDHASYATTGDGDTLRIALEDGAPTTRPPDLSQAEATAAVQQLVYTAQAAIGKRVPVVFTVGRHPTSAHATLLGVDISHPVPAGPVLDTLSLISISDPNQGQVVSGHLTVTGANNGFEGSVLVYLERHGRRQLVTPTIGGWGGDTLYPWTVTLDLGKVAPGTYTLVARNDDPSGQGRAPVDDRVIEVE